MKINLLDSLIYNRIAAGEVVEKPASVVKELVENSIDAGSAEITISIQNGGIDNITITDNGCGIDVSDIKNAFLPHATSKISKIDDLDSICTLGFRGEALPS
ncbi:MAG: ATP-binding protein, partial [Clostridia bacterium]